MEDVHILALENNSEIQSKTTDNNNPLHIILLRSPSMLLEIFLLAFSKGQVNFSLNLSWGN